MQYQEGKQQYSEQHEQVDGQYPTQEGGTMQVRAGTTAWCSTHATAAAACAVPRQYPMCTLPPAPCRACSTTLSSTKRSCRTLRAAPPCRHAERRWVVLMRVLAWSCCGCCAGPAATLLQPGSALQRVRRCVMTHQVSSLPARLPSCR